MKIKRSIVAITGAAGGLGAAMAKRLAKQGARLALIDFNPDMLYELNDASASPVGLPARVVAGMNQLLFTSDGFGNYAWSGF